MRKFHLLVVSCLVGAIAACLTVRTPNASATIEAVPAVVVAEADPIPEGDATTPPGSPMPGTPANLENGPPPNDPVLNDALAAEKEKTAPAPAPAPEEPAKPKKSLKDSRAFAQTPAKKTARENAGMKSKKGGKKKAEKKHGKKKKKKA